MYVLDILVLDWADLLWFVMVCYGLGWFVIVWFGSPNSARNMGASY